MAFCIDVGGEEIEIGTRVAEFLFGKDYTRQYAQQWTAVYNYDPECFKVILRQAATRLLLKTSPCGTIPNHLEHGVRAMAWHMDVCDKLGIKPPITSQPLLDANGKSNILSAAESCIVMTNAVIDGECSWTISGADISKMAVGVVPVGFYDGRYQFWAGTSDMVTNDGWWIYYTYDDDYGEDASRYGYKSEHLGDVKTIHRGHWPGPRTKLTLTASGTLMAKIENVPSEIVVARNISFPVVPAVFFGPKGTDTNVTVEWC